MPKGHRTDENQSAIVRQLKAIGATVLDFSAVGGGCPDILTGIGGRNILFEIKRPNGKARDTQKEFAKTWKGEAYLIRSFDDALQVINKVDGYKDKFKFE